MALKLSVAAAIVTFAQLSTASAADKSSQHIDQTDQLIVKYKDAVAIGKSPIQVQPLGKERMAKVVRAGQQYGLTMKALRTMGTGANIFKLGRKMSNADVYLLAKELMATDPAVEYAEPDRIMQPMFTPNDPMYAADQWNLRNTSGGLNLPLAWDKATGTGIKVAVVDSGYRPHADLAGQFLLGYDFISDATEGRDGNGRDDDAIDPGNWQLAGECGVDKPAKNSTWHGTGVAGVIVALTNNVTGVAGVAFNTKVVPVRVSGKCGPQLSDVTDAIIWASGGSVPNVPANTNAARVINLSFGGLGACPASWRTAIDIARSRNSVVITAAGNDSADASGFTPGNCFGVINVASVDSTGSKATTSNYGSVVDIAAPGGIEGAGVMMTLNSGQQGPAGDNYSTGFGTSIAAPHVSGVAALMLSKNNWLTVNDVESKLKSTARAFPLGVTCTGCGAGIVNPLAAINAVTNLPTKTEIETNNNFGNADQVLSSGTTALGNMGSNTDIDYFSVVLPAYQTLTATLMMGNSTADYDLGIYASNGTTFLTGSTNLAGITDVASVTNTGATPMTYFIRVKYWSGGTGAVNGTYGMKLSW